MTEVGQQMGRFAARDAIRISGAELIEGMDAAGDVLLKSRGTRVSGRAP